MRESDKIRLQGHAQSQKSARESMHETSEINGLYVPLPVDAASRIYRPKGKGKIQRFCSPQCMNNYHRNDDKDALNRFADKSKMTRQHGKQTANAERKP
ncbi:hypothetical protein [Bifidobacterium sp. ESL0825]|uniref:hypothetical protein n=1 Tax=Bifidobacterium sp. ESL0825 TaxID=3448587 RepID=UPI004042A25F